MESQVNGKSLIYVVDPMCSWCWGFSPVFEAIVQRYQDQVLIHLLVGGLRPGNRKPFDAGMRDYVLHHWHAVHERTGQPFNFTFQMPPDFTYDTEPPSRALRVVRQLAPAMERGYLKAVQQAFHVQNSDVTRESVLSEIAEEQGMDPGSFFGLFRDPVLKQETWKEFAQAREWGVDSFPTLLGFLNNQVSLLVQGYQPLEHAMPIIADWLAGDEEA